MFDLNNKRPRGKITNSYGTYRTITEDDLSKIKELHIAGMIDKEIAEIVGCCKSTISKKIREMGLR